MCHIRYQSCVSTTAPKEQIYILCSILRAGDDVEIRTNAEAGVHQMACAVWGRMQRPRQPQTRVPGRAALWRGWTHIGSFASVIDSIRGWCRQAASSDTALPEEESLWTLPIFRQWPQSFRACHRSADKSLRDFLKGRQGVFLRGVYRVGVP